MPENKHTLGPWMVGYSDGSGAREGEYCITNGTQAVVVGGESFGSSHGVRRIEDARLIAAAPDLLEALKQVVTRCGPRSQDGQMARAAIAKAEGQS